MSTCLNNSCTNTWEEEPPVAIFIASNLPGNGNHSPGASWGYYCGYSCALTDIGNELLPLIEGAAPVLAVVQDEVGPAPELTPTEDDGTVTMPHFAGEEVPTIPHFVDNGEAFTEDAPAPEPDFVVEVNTGNAGDSQTAQLLAEVWKSIEASAQVVAEQAVVPAPQPVEDGDTTAAERLVETSELCCHLSEALAHDYAFNVSTTNQAISIGGATTARLIYTLVNQHGTFIVTHDVDNIYVSFGEKFNFVAPAKDFIESGQYDNLKQALLAV